MSNRKTLRIFFVYLVVFFLTLSLSMGFIVGCSKKKAKSPSKKPSSEKQISNDLKEMQREIETVIKDFEKVFIMQTAPPPKPQKPKETEKKQSKSQGQGEQQGGEKQEEGGQGGQGSSGKQQSSQGTSTSPGPDWPKLEKNISRIHSQWNSYQSEALKAGASMKMVNDFSTKLNELTMILTRQELYQGLHVANDLYVKAAAFENLYETKIPPELKEVIYYGRKATYQSLQEDEFKATKSMQDALNTWEKIKPKIKDKDKAGQAEFAMKELNQAIKEKDPNLIKIKAQVAQKSIQDVMMSMEKSK